MANGIQDLTSIMMEGGRGDVPPQPMMGGGLGAMMPQQAAPMPSPDMGGMPSPDMGGMSPDMMMAEQMPMEEEPMSIEQDAGALAEAVVGRAQGDIDAAVAILDTAKAMLVQSTQQDPMMEQDPMMMAQGGPMYAMGGKYMKPKYADKGLYLSDESDTLRQMIMERMNSQMGRTMSDSEMGRTMSDAERSAFREAIGMQSGRELTQKDLDFLKEMMNSRREGTFDPEADNLRLDMGLDAQYYNELEDERKRAAERAKLYRSR